jgi:hypothetical protein
MAKRSRRFEGSPADIRKDKAGAKKLGISMKAYEKTPQDRAEDRAGQRALPPPNTGRPAQRQMFGKGGRK